MKAVLIALLLTGCSVNNLGDCASTWNGDGCPVNYWDTQCRIPMLKPEGRMGCFAPSGRSVSPTWCCQT